MAKQPSAVVRAHLEWLGFIQPTGLVVSAHALEQAGAVLNRRDAEGQRLLEECVRESAFGPGGEPEPYLPDFETFARTVLGWNFSPAGYAGTDAAPIPQELEIILTDYGETLRPDFAVRERDPEEGQSPWQLLVSVVEPGTDVDQVARKGTGLEASPHGRLERLIRATRVPAGVLFNGRVIRLVSAPRGESSGWMDFQVGDMRPVAGRPLCAALRLLLSQTRLLTGLRDHRLAGLLQASRKYQNVVSERLSEQVLHGLYELLRGLQSAHEQSHGTLLARELEQDPDNIYRALLTVMLRLVFLLYAEERGLLSVDATFVDHYSVVGLFERLREDAGLHPDTMDDRYGAWAQLLVLFRMVHDGAKSGGLRLPARRGDLFSPGRFPFLEGWHGERVPHGSSGATEPPLVPDGTIYRVLDKLLVLDGERISYRALDVEQIGSVYETMMGFRLDRATGRSVAIKSQKKGGAPTTIDLDGLLAEAPPKRLKWIRDRTERKLTPTVAKLMRAAGSVTELHAALATVVDSAATPDLVPRGAMILEPSDERRRSGSHYTPRELTAPIVEETLKPILERLSGGGSVPIASDLLDLKICDPAMGSAAFLVEACRYLADRLVEAWKVYGGRPDVPEGEDELIFARRIVAQRCLYGVDRNPMAVDLAKMSLWLATLARDEPLTFVDHALRDGDSLVGLTRMQIAAFTWKRGEFQPEHGMRVDDAVADAEDWRGMIRDAEPIVSQVELEKMWREAAAAITDVRFYGDLAVEAFFLETRVTAREMRRLAHLAAVQDGDTSVHRERLAEKRKGHRPLAPFHWEIEFPEVFDRKNPGFDAFVGNPPFLGGKRISTTLGDAYRDWLAELHQGASRNTDLVAHFFRRAFDLLRKNGCLGLIATNTIAQGDTRAGGLRWICTHGGEIYRAITRTQWPGQAAVVVSVTHVTKGNFDGLRQLDGRSVETITAFLSNTGVHEDPTRLKANMMGSYVGSFLRGIGFTFDDTDTKGVALPLSEKRRLIEKHPRNGEVIFPYIGWKEVNTSPTHSHHRYVINFGQMPLQRTVTETQWRDANDKQRRAYLRQGIVPVDYPDPVAADWPDLLAIVEDRVRPERIKVKRKAHRLRWWQYGDHRPALYAAAASLPRVLVTGAAATKHYALAMVPSGQVYSHKLIVFPLATHAAFCALQSRLHETWSRFFGATLGDALTYNPSDVFETFPFPRNWTNDPTLEAAGRAYYSFRADLMVQNNEGLTKTYNRFHDPAESDPGIVRLRELHAGMDRAVLSAYGWNDIDMTCQFLLDYEIDDEEWSSRRKKPWRYRWLDPVRNEVLGRLMALNDARSAEQRRQ